MTAYSSRFWQGKSDLKKSGLLPLKYTLPLIFLWIQAVVFFCINHGTQLDQVEGMYKCNSATATSKQKN